MRASRCLVLLLSLAGLFPAFAVAGTFPDRPVTIVVPFPPGGSVDGAARILGQELQELTGKSVVVENRAQGAGGTAGSATVARAAPDGYTLLFNASIHVVQPLINPNVHFDVVNDFTHIALIAGGPLIVTTHPSVPARNLKEFFETLKANPNQYTLATSGLGSAGHLTVEFLRQQAGVETPILAYRGGGPVLNDMVGGHVHLLADPMLSTLPNVQAGRLKPLAVTSRNRTPLAPDVPTFEENGLPPFEMLSWYGLWAPRDLAPDAAAFLAKEVAAVVTSERFKQRLGPLGFEPMYKDSAALKAFVVSEMSRYEPIVKGAKFKAQ